MLVLPMSKHIAEKDIEYLTFDDCKIHEIILIITGWPVMMLRNLEITKDIDTAIQHITRNKRMMQSQN